MKGLMMDHPLLIADILKFASDAHGSAGVISAAAEGGIHQQTYSETLQRSAKLANALKQMGINHADRVATLAWNGYRHLELYYAVSGMGAVCHTVNPRLSNEQLIYIINHAEDKVIFCDFDFIPILEGIKENLPKSIPIVIMTDAAHMPETSLENIHCYEDLLAKESDNFDWPIFDENTAAGLCYTSGTTGNPKGSLYSHRSTVLHALSTSMAFNNSLQADRNIMPVVPQFHVKAWGTPYAAPLSGASIVMPGSKMDGKSLYELISKTNVFASFGVPTIWQGVLDEIRKRGAAPKSLKELFIGGSAAPRSMIEGFADFGIKVIHVWGMTEISPIGTHCNLTEDHNSLSSEEQMWLKSTQGRRVFGVEMKIVDDKGTKLDHNGKNNGELYVRGPFVISGYYKNQEATDAAFDKDGWFGTGDVSNIDEGGFMSITDRAKDMIKSGGEWISSIDLENAAVAHEAVSSCAAIGVKHHKWDERPILVVVANDKSQENENTKAGIISLLAKNFAKWQLPDEIIFEDTLPLTATKKVSKKDLRNKYYNYFS